MKLNKFAACIFMLLLLCGFALAEQDSFVLNDEYANNLYLTHSDVEINSNLYGDLFILSDVLDVNALVRDDINGIAQDFSLSGTVGSDVRVISSEANITGTVFGELMIAGNTVEISDDAAIGGNTKIYANIVEINGTLKKDLYVNADKVILNGVVEGNAIIKASEFELGPKAQILGDLSSSKDISEVSGKVKGTVTKTEGKENPDSFTAMTFRKIGLFMALFLIGAALVFSAPKFAEKSAKTSSGRFLLSLALGFLILVAIPFAIIFISFTLVALPLAIMLGLVYLLLIILAFGMTAVLVGRAGIRIFKGKRNIWVELLIGALALALMSIIPALFWTLSILLVLASMGGFVLASLRKDRR